MFNWTAFTLFLFITMRVSGCVVLNPIFGRAGIPRRALAGYILVLSYSVYSVYGGGSLRMPGTVLELGLRLVLELAVGFVFGMVMRFFLYIPDQTGENVDMQMGLSMARMYDPSTQTQTTTTANMLSILSIELFFAAGGHVTLLRIMLTSGDMVPFGEVTPGPHVADRAVELFAECVLLSFKLAMPILGAELMGQIGMGVLMKAIPSINVFTINLELKILIGLFMLMFLMGPIGDYLLDAEAYMLEELRAMLELLHGG